METLDNARINRHVQHKHLHRSSTRKVKITDANHIEIDMPCDPGVQDPTEQGAPCAECSKLASKCHFDEFDCSQSLQVKCIHHVDQGCQALDACTYQKTNHCQQNGKLNPTEWSNGLIQTGQIKNNHNIFNQSIPDPEMYLSMDCEFVGVGSRKLSALGRCSIVDFHGRVVLDVYAKPDEHITDFRTPWSGLRPRDMRHAVPFSSARNSIRKALKGKIVVGHSLLNDFKVLQLFPPPSFVRDIGKCSALRTQAGYLGNQPVGLKKLALNLLGRRIQRGEHCSVEDALATLDLFKLVRVAWESELQHKGPKGPCEQDLAGRSRTVSETSCESFTGDKYWPADLHQ